MRYLEALLAGIRVNRNLEAADKLQAIFPLAEFDVIADTLYFPVVALTVATRILELVDERERGLLPTTILTPGGSVAGAANVPLGFRFVSRLNKIAQVELFGYSVSSSTPETTAKFYGGIDWPTVFADSRDYDAEKDFRSAFAPDRVHE